MDIILNYLDFKFFALFLITVMYVYCATIFMIIFKKRRLRRNKKFYKTLSNGFKDGNIESPQDIRNIFNGIFNLSCDIDDSVHCNKIVNLLRKYLVQFINNEDEASDPNIICKTNCNIKKKVTEFIDYYEKQYPYSDLPIAEMNILNDINVFIANNDVESIKRKINELAGIIQVRNDDIKGLKNSNKWSIPLAVIGLILTIIFGILSYIK